MGLFCRAINLQRRYTPAQLLAKRDKITKNPRNRAPADADDVFKRAPKRKIKDIDLALKLHYIHGEIEPPGWWRYDMELVAKP